MEKKKRKTTEELLDICDEVEKALTGYRLTRADVMFICLNIILDASYQIIEERLIEEG